MMISPWLCILTVTLSLDSPKTKDVELVYLLLAAAEKVSYQQFVRASRQLSRCEFIAYEKSDPVQRIVFYFAAALRERIAIETGRTTAKGLLPRRRRTDHGLDYNVTSLICYKNLPFHQLLYFTAIQTILEKLRRKVSFI